MAEIEELKKQLAPWTEKINDKKKNIDVRKSEQELLAEKLTSGKKAVEHAEKQLARIKEQKRSKACIIHDDMVYIVLMEMYNRKLN